MYKMSDNAYLLLPSTNEQLSLYAIFFVLFVIMLVFKTFAIVYRIVEQSNVDVVLMDWERPKKISQMDTDKQVITWRSIFISNEFNEL